VRDGSFFSKTKESLVGPALCGGLFSWRSTRYGARLSGRSLHIYVVLR